MMLMLSISSFCDWILAFKLFSHTRCQPFVDNINCILCNNLWSLRLFTLLYVRP